MSEIPLIGNTVIIESDDGESWDGVVVNVKNRKTPECTIDVSADGSLDPGSIQTFRILPNGKWTPDTFEDKTSVPAPEFQKLITILRNR